MQDIDRISCYQGLHKSSLERFFRRREFEWKFNLVLWTPLAILIGFSVRGEKS